MEFLVSKTRSDYDDNFNVLQPHKDAYRKKYDRIEVRTLYNEEDFDKKFGEREGLWRSKGVDHTKNKDGYIQRRHILDCEDWFMKIADMDSLLKFVNDNGDIVLKESDGDHYSIEIYDDYRE